MSGYSEFECPVSDLIGKTLTRCERLGASIEFDCTDGCKYTMFHSQGCCETVDIEDICGELDDLVGSPIVQAEEPSSGDTTRNPKPDWEPESFTWTFYRIATAKGQVVIRWYGSSNGYYSESVSFSKTK